VAQVRWAGLFNYRFGLGCFVLIRELNPWCTELLEKHALLQSPSRIEELVKIFIHATNVSGLELNAWPERRKTLANEVGVKDGDWFLGDVSCCIEYGQRSTRHTIHYRQGFIDVCLS
jgi:hypothetical protein